MNKTALIIIDLQNDYFDDGLFPLWESNKVLDKTIKFIDKTGISEIVLIQHIADSAEGISPFFNENTKGVEIHDLLKTKLSSSKVIIKKYADSFDNTDLDNYLQSKGIQKILICGMMTQNCITQTAMSEFAKKYNPVVLGDLCTIVSEMVHLIALNALERKVNVSTSDNY